MSNIVDPDQTAPIGAVCSGSTLFASMLKFACINWQLFAADNIFRFIFLDALRANCVCREDSDQPGNQPSQIRFFMLP